MPNMKNTAKAMIASLLFLAACTEQDPMPKNDIFVEMVDGYNGKPWEDMSFDELEEFRQTPEYKRRAKQRETENVLRQAAGDPYPWLPWGR